MNVATWIFNLFADVPPQLGTFLLAMLPFTEFQLAFPFAVQIYRLDVWQALFFSFAGNILIFPLTLLLFRPFFRFAEAHSKYLHAFLDHRVRSLQRKNAKKYERYGSIFLFMLVAIPLPGSGVWTASIVSIIFGIRPGRAFPIILVGQVVALTVVWLVTNGLTLLI